MTFHPGSGGGAAPPLTDAQLIERGIYEKSLIDFVEQGWRHVEPAKFDRNWHIEAICDHAEEIATGKLKRLLVTIPPRHMKSLGLQVFFPAWVWAQDPRFDPLTNKTVDHPYHVMPGQLRGCGVRFAFISYGQELSNDHSVKCRQLIESPWYQSLWGERFRLREDSNRIQRFDTLQGGHRLALSFHGKITGFGADIIGIDDPHNLENIDSDDVREEVLRKWDEVLPTRLNDPESGVFMVVMQRSHQKDLIGHILEKEFLFTKLDLSDPEAGRKKWVPVCLPARFERDHPLTFVTPVKRRGSDRRLWTDERVEGEALWKNRFTDDVLKEWEGRLGSHAAAGQLQQRPTAREGGMFKETWFQKVDSVPPICLYNRVRSWDLAATAETIKTDPDWTVGMLMSRDPSTNVVYIEDVIRVRETPYEVEKKIVKAAWADTRRCRIRLPREPGSSGKFQIAHLVGKLAGYIVHPEPEIDGKSFRAQALAAQAEAGNVRILKGAWNEKFIEEMCAFPAGSHDDQVDAASGGFRVLHSSPNVPLHSSYGAAG